MPARRKIEPIRTDDDVIIILARIRDKALDDLRSCVFDNDYNRYSVFVKAVRDSHDEIAKLMKMRLEDPSKVRGEIRLEFMPAKG
jgi:hypothetical protein